MLEHVDSHVSMWNHLVVDCDEHIVLYLWQVSISASVYSFFIFWSHFTQQMPRMAAKAGTFTISPLEVHVRCSGAS